MVKKLAVLFATAVTAFALLPAVEASASHSAGGYARSCFYRQSKAYNGVEVAVEGRGSDSPANALIAARGRVSASAACNRANGVGVIRVQLDRVALLAGAKVVKEGGPFANGTTYILADSPGQGGISCATNLRVYVHFSARYSDNSLAGGGTYGPYFRKPGC